MGKVKQINIKSQTYYYLNDIINIENFDPRLLKLTKNHTKAIYNRYIIIKKIDREKIHIVNPLCFY